MQVIDAVNIILPKVGERPVLNVEDPHPTVAILLPILEQTLRRLLLSGWWFNEEVREYQPDENSEIMLPSDVVKFIPDACTDAVVRGDQLYNIVEGTYVWSAPVSGVAYRYIEFSALPETAAQYVMYGAAVDLMHTDMGVSNESQVLLALAQSAYSDLVQEHLQNRRYSTRQHRQWRKLLNAMR